MICIEVFRPDELSLEKLKLEATLKVQQHEQNSKKKTQENFWSKKKLLEVSIDTEAD